MNTTQKFCPVSSVTIRRHKIHFPIPNHLYNLQLTVTQHSCSAVPHISLLITKYPQSQPSSNCRHTLDSAATGSGFCCVRNDIIVL